MFSGTKSHHKAPTYTTSNKQKTAPVPTKVKKMDKAWRWSWRLWGWSKLWWWLWWRLWWWLWWDHNCDDCDDDITYSNKNNMLTRQTQVLQMFGRASFILVWQKLVKYWGQNCVRKVLLFSRGFTLHDFINLTWKHTDIDSKYLPVECGTSDSLCVQHVWKMYGYFGMVAFLMLKVQRQFGVQKQNVA